MTSPAPQTATPPDAQTKVCPQCSETILAVARKCKHCGSMLGLQKGGFKGRVRKRRSHGEGRSAILFGILSYPLMIIPIVGLVMSFMAVQYGLSARKFESERVAGTIGLVLGLGTLVFVLGVVLLVVILAIAGAVS